MGGWGEEGLELVCGRPTLTLDSALVHQTKQLQQKHYTTKQEQVTKSLNQIKTLNIYFYLFSDFYQKSLLWIYVVVVGHAKVSYISEHVFITHVLLRLLVYVGVRSL